MTDEELAGWARNWHWNDTAIDQPVDPSIYFRDMRMLRAFIAEAEARRAAEKRKNCKHINKFGSGSVGSDGSSKMTWYCKDCHASGSIETAARPASAPALLFNGAAGADLMRCAECTCANGGADCNWIAQPRIDVSSQKEPS